MPIPTFPPVLDSRSGPANRASRPLVQGPAIALTTPFGVAATGVFTSTAHGLGANAEVQFDSLAGPTANSPVLGQSYYARDITANTFTLALTPGGTVVKWTTDATAGSIRKYTGSNIVASNDVDVTS
jgi:hypothetical protein